jgi:membrane carboxypeptidase/penicillin-binding protein
VPTDQIEAIVGATRHATDHIGRAVSAEETVYILHSQECRDSGVDLRECPYSSALDEGIDPSTWVEDAPVRLAIVDGRLVIAAKGPADV